MRSYELNLDLGFKRFKKKVRAERGVWGGVPLYEYLLCNIKYDTHGVYKEKEHTIHKAFK